MDRGQRSNPGQGSLPPKYPGTFLLAFREAVAGLNWQVRRWLGSAVECLDDAGREQVIGLENLFRRARREDRAAWPDVIAGFLRSVHAEHCADPPPDLGAVADRLLVRVGPPPAPRADGLEVWSAPLAGTGLGLNLVVDYPQSMFYVTAQMISATGRPGDEWLGRALANLQALTPADCFQVLHPESGMRQCGVGDAYDSSRVLLLDALLPAYRADGYFAALPGRDELLVLPVTTSGLAHVPLLKALAKKNYKTVPYPISDEVFWLQDNVWRLFPIAIRGERVTVKPPAEFTEVLKRLMPEQDGEGPGDASAPPGEDESKD
jgi:hypothetical protein